MKNIAIDPGFDSFKAAEARPDDTYLEVSIPSVVGIGTTDLGLLDIDSVGGKKAKRNKPLTITFAGEEYLVGQHVSDYARPIERLDFNRLTDAPELRALTYATLYKILDGGENETAIIIGLPVEVLQSPDAAETVKTLSEWLVGAHTFSVNGKTASVTVSNLRVRAQPLGAFFDWGLGSNGEWARTAAEWKKQIAVLDLGFNTLDLFALREGNIVGRYTGGDTVGMRRAAATLADHIRRTTGRSLSLQEANALLRDCAGGRKPILSINGSETPLVPLVRQALNAAAGEVTAFVARQWGNGRQFDQILLTGGGALALKDQLTKSLPHAIMLENPVTANARGLAKYAQRADVWSKSR